MRYTFFLLIIPLIFLGVGCQPVAKPTIPVAEQGTRGVISPIEPPQEHGYIENYVIVKYRSDPVNISHPRFESLDTSKSSWILGAWYDAENDYMIINLNGTSYQYCGFPGGVWDTFKRADSFGEAYDTMIEGRYGCDGEDIPRYDNENGS